MAWSGDVVQLHQNNANLEFVVPDEGNVIGLFQEGLLPTDRGEDGRPTHTGGFRDRLDRGGDVAALDEQGRRGVDDRAPRRRRLRLSQRRFV